MHFLQILAFLASAIVSIWLLGIFLGSAFHPRAKQVGLGNLIVGVLLLALAVWLPFAFGWVAS